jgi:hypothetical protein
MGDEAELVGGFQYGDDSPPLMNRVPEQPPSHWGKLTSQARTLSPQYLRFLSGRDQDHERPE